MPKVRLMTKRLISGVFFGFALAWLFVIGYAERYSEGERLWLFGATHDAGKVQRGSVLEHWVWVYNPSDKTRIRESAGDRYLWIFAFPCPQVMLRSV